MLARGQRGGAATPVGRCMLWGGGGKSAVVLLYCVRSSSRGQGRGCCLRSSTCCPGCAAQPQMTQLPRQEASSRMSYCLFAVCLSQPPSSLGVQRLLLCWGARARPVASSSCRPLALWRHRSCCRGSPSWRQRLQGAGLAIRSPQTICPVLAHSNVSSSSWQFGNLGPDVVYLVCFVAGTLWWRWGHTVLLPSLSLLPTCGLGAGWVGQWVVREAGGGRNTTLGGRCCV